MIMELLVTTAYAAFFVFLIGRVRFFEVEGIARKWFQLIFILKILAGVALWYIYTFYYTDRISADIYKYFDSSEVIYNSLFTHPIDYFKMITGLGDDTGFRERYFLKVHNWYRQYSSNMFNDNQTMIRYNAVLRIFSFGFYHVHSVFTCFLSLVGLTAIYKSFFPLLKDKKKELFCVVFLMPSVLFWGSGVLKESLLFFTLGIFIFSFKRISEKKYSPFLFISFFLSLGMMLILKMYVIIALMPGILAIMLFTLSTKIKNSFLLFLSCLLIFLFSAAYVNRIIPAIDPVRTLSSKQNNFIELGRGNTLLIHGDDYLLFSDGNRNCMEPAGDTLKYRIKAGCPCTMWKLPSRNIKTEGLTVSDTSVYEVVHDFTRSNSYFEITRLKSEPINFLKTMPEAFLNTLMRPFPNGVNSPIMLVSALENMIVPSCILLLLLFRKRNPENMHWVWFCLTFVVVLFLIIGWTTPVAGAIVRYKTPALPFLFIALLFLYDKEKLLIRFRFKKKISE